MSDLVWLEAGIQMLAEACSGQSAQTLDLLRPVLDEGFRRFNQFEGSKQEWERQRLPDGPITVGIDGGYVRAAHKHGWFEVIAGKRRLCGSRGAQEIDIAEINLVIRLKPQNVYPSAELSRALAQAMHYLQVIEEPSAATR